MPFGHSILTEDRTIQSLLPEGGTGSCPGIQRLIQTLVASKGLDPRAKHPICITMKAALVDAAVQAHMPNGKTMGAARIEVVDAILMTFTASGI
jgi:alkylhydroperoxidase/carboxymuconolactone decarboxylase family protein YurZ